MIRAQAGQLIDTFINYVEGDTPEEEDGVDVAERVEVLEPLLVAFDDGRIEVIADIEKQLYGMSESVGIPFTYISNMTFCDSLVKAIATFDLDDGRGLPIVLSCLHVYDMVCGSQNVRTVMAKLAENDNGAFFANIVTMIRRGEPILVCFCLRALKRMISNDGQKIFDALVNEFGLVDEIVKLLGGDPGIVEEIAEFMKEAVPWMLEGPGLRFFMRVAVVILEMGMIQPCRIMLFGVKRLLDHSRDYGILEVMYKPENFRLIELFLAALNTQDLVAPALIMLDAIIHADNYDILVDLCDRFGLLERLMAHMQSDDPIIAESATALILPCMLTKGEFIEKTVNSGIVQMLCEQADKGDYRMKNKAVTTIASLLCRHHNPVTMSAIIETGGLACMCKLLPDLQHQQARHVVMAFNHILRTVPIYVGNIADGCLETLEEITTNETDTNDEDERNLIVTTEAFLEDMQVILRQKRPE